MAEQIAEGLYRLDIPLPGNPLKNLNSYPILMKVEIGLSLRSGIIYNSFIDTIRTE